VYPVSKKRVRIDVTIQQSSRLREEVFGNLRLSGVERRRVVRKEFPIPADGSPVDLYCDGQFVGEV
jgi:hypothetical protein